MFFIALLIFSVSWASAADVYYVERGDTLSNIGKYFGKSWREIAKINGIVKPYRIYPGQKLYLSEDNLVVVQSIDVKSVESAPIATKPVETAPVEKFQPSPCKTIDPGCKETGSETQETKLKGPEVDTFTTLGYYWEPRGEKTNQGTLINTRMRFLAGQKKTENGAYRHGAYLYGEYVDGEVYGRNDRNRRVNDGYIAYAFGAGYSGKYAGKGFETAFDVGYLGKFDRSRTTSQDSHGFYIGQNTEFTWNDIRKEKSNFLPRTDVFASVYIPFSENKKYNGQSVDPDKKGYINARIDQGIYEFKNGNTSVIPGISVGGSLPFNGNPSGLVGAYIDFDYKKIGNLVRVGVDLTMGGIHNSTKYLVSARVYPVRVAKAIEAAQITPSTSAYEQERYGVNNERVVLASTTTEADYQFNLMKNGG